MSGDWVWVRYKNLPKDKLKRLKDKSLLVKPDFVLVDSFVARELRVPYEAHSRLGPVNNITRHYVVRVRSEIELEGTKLDSKRYVVHERDVMRAVAHPHVLYVASLADLVSHTVYSAVSTENYFGADSIDFVGSNSTVFVVDTGLDPYHCFFASNATVYSPKNWYEYEDDGNEKVKVMIQTCLDVGCERVSDVFDVPSGHGTHVSGISVGEPCNSLYGAQPNARLVFAGISFEGRLRIPANFSDIMEFAYAQGARTGSFSWGDQSTTSGLYGDLSSQIDDFLFEHDDFVLVVSSGNSGPRGGADPATAKNVLSIGASFLPFEAYSSGSRGFMQEFVQLEPSLYDVGTVASFSAAGPWADGRKAPHLCAPGVNLLSAQADPEVQDLFTMKTGTSMAAAAMPTVLVRSLLEERLGFSPPSSLVRAALISWTRPAQQLAYVYADFAVPEPFDVNNRCFYGVSQYADMSWAASVIDLQPYETYFGCFVAETEHVSVSIAWNEPGSFPGNYTVLNDIQLFVFENGTKAMENETFVRDNHQRVSLDLERSSVFFVSVVSLVAYDISTTVSMFAANATFLSGPCGCESYPCLSVDKQIGYWNCTTQTCSSNLHVYSEIAYVMPVANPIVYEIQTHEQHGVPMHILFGGLDATMAVGSFLVIFCNPSRSFLMFALLSNATSTVFLQLTYWIAAFHQTYVVLGCCCWVFAVNFVGTLVNKNARPEMLLFFDLLQMLRVYDLLWLFVPGVSWIFWVFVLFVIVMWVVMNFTFSQGLMVAQALVILVSIPAAVQAYDESQWVAFWFFSILSVVVLVVFLAELSCKRHSGVYDSNAHLQKVPLQKRNHDE